MKTIPTTSLDRIVDSNVKITLVETKELDGNVMSNELETITKIVAHHKPQRIFEIGTFDGRTTINLAKNTPGNTKIFTLDLPQDQVDSVKLNLYSHPEIERDDKWYIDKPTIGDRYAKYSEKKNITQLLGDSASFDFSPYYNSIDFVFVDGSHAKEYVQNDTEVALKLAGKNSVIMWHDYTNWDDVGEVLGRYYDKDERFKDLAHIEGTTFLYLAL